MFLLRLFRLTIFVLIAFVAGLFVERSHQMSRYEATGGIWLPTGFCGER